MPCVPPNARPNVSFKDSDGLIAVRSYCKGWYSVRSHAIKQLPKILRDTEVKYILRLRNSKHDTYWIRIALLIKFPSKNCNLYHGTLNNIVSELIMWENSTNKKL
jgi:hypothetical protein